MESFFGKYRKQNALPHLLLDIVRKYFRLEVEGLENVPKTGRCLVVPNHSGVTALDAVMIAHEIHRGRRRIPQMLAHPLWFIGPNIRILAKRMGLVEANKDAGENLLKRGKIVILFPEGASGNFKPTAKRYQLQEFRRGFVRMAMASKAPIVPTVVIGAEESNINLSALDVSRLMKNTYVPMPLNVVPLPAKWKIIFLPPISMAKYSKKHADNHDLVYKVCEQVKTQIQERINEEIAKREWIYFPKPTATKSKAKAKSRIKTT